MNLFMRFYGGKKKALTLSYDDGVEQDKRLVEILQKNGLKGTFNLNSGCYAKEGTVYPAGTIHRRMTKKQVTELFAESGMEVAVHALTHPGLEQLPAAACMQEILQDRLNLEKQFGRIVRGMAYPFGTYSDGVIQCIKCAGIAYARTVISSGGFAVPKDWLQLEATCHHNDERLMPLAKRFVEESPKGSPWLFYLWGHSYEFEEKDNWQVIEGFAEYTGGREDIWYATNIQVYEYVEAYRRLVFCADNGRVYNPTAYTVWFEADGREVCVKPGETVDMEP